MRVQRTVFIVCLIIFAFLVLAAYSYRELVIVPRLQATSSQVANSMESVALPQPSVDKQQQDSDMTELVEDESEGNEILLIESSDGDDKAADGNEILSPDAPADVKPSADYTLDKRSITQNAGVKQQIIFDDNLLENWHNWSWGTTLDFQSSSQVESGDTSISITFDDAWGAMWLSSFESVSAADYDVLRFWIHGGADGGQSASVSLADGSQTLLDTAVIIDAAANTWLQVDIPLADLQADFEISGISFQDALGGSQPTFFVDQVSFVQIEDDLFSTQNEVAAAASPIDDGTKRVEISIDVNAERRQINPDIYGINYGSDALIAELGHTVRRWGGNATTRYNWQLDVSNRASDWFFENIAEDVEDPSALPKGSSADRFVVANQAVGAKTIMTMPMIGWTPKSRDLACSFPISKYGPQQQVDQWRPDCGNGYTTNGDPIAADPYDTSIDIDPTFVSAWIDYLVNEFGNASQDGVTFYALDNEPMLWHHTHRDVHPEPVGYDELYERSVNYASAIKRADPSALTLGPALWGWSAYEYSAKDLVEGGGVFNRYPDRAAHGDMPLVAWYLQQMANYERQYGIRILDYLDIHYYPQANGVALSPAGGRQTREVRLRSTRSLWDSTYTDESWIGEPVRLIPRMREWIDEYYPGTKLALTEYNFGGLDSINGALAQAEVLGIFGREGVDLATLWAPLDAGTPFTFAFQIYRNYDGNGNKFGDVSIRSTSAAQDQLSVFAAQRSSDSAVTVLVINKSDDAIDGEIEIANFQPAGLALRHRYSAGNLADIQVLPELELTDDKIVDRFPQNSFTLLVIQ